MRSLSRNHDGLRIRSCFKDGLLELLGSRYYIKGTPRIEGEVSDSDLPTIIDTHGMRVPVGAGSYG